MKKQNDTMKRLIGFINVAEKREHYKEEKREHYKSVLEDNNKTKRKKKKRRSIGMSM